MSDCTQSPADQQSVSVEMPATKKTWHTAELATQFAAVTAEVFKNRTDAIGVMKTGGSITEKTGIANHIANHFQANRKARVGCHSTSKTNTCKWGAIDIDLHDPECKGKTAEEVQELRDKNERYVMHLRDKMIEQGFNPLLEDSNGRGGYHLWLFFDEPADSGTVYAFLKQLVADHKFDKEPETFPKQSSTDAYGNYLRLPGRHYKREHESVFYCNDAEAWLTVDKSVELFLRLGESRDSVSLLDSVKVVEPEPEFPTASFGHTEERDIADGILWSRLLDRADFDLTSEKTEKGIVKQYWAYAGSEKDISGTLNHAGSDTFTCFTTSHPKLEGGKHYGKFTFIATVFFDGDHNAARESLLSYDFGFLKEGWQKETSNEYKPFPVDSLPVELQSIVSEGAESIGCDAAYIALPALSVCASAVGGSRILRIKNSWKAPSVLWTMVIGESGTSKTPAFKLATGPMTKRQSRLAKDHAVKTKHHKADLARRKKEKDKSEEPEAPIRECCSVSDTTIEALAPILQDNPNGVLLQRDELSGWFGSFNQYSGGKANADEPKWLEIYSTSPVNIDRKSSDAPNISVERPVVSICGGIQPGVYQRCFSGENVENGMQSRFLVAHPPRVTAQWTDADVSQETLDAYDELVTRLCGQQRTDGEAIEVELDADAKRLFTEFFNRNGKEQAKFVGPLSSQWSKMREIPARLALAFHCVKVGDGIGTTETKLDAETMRSAITITEWFKSEALRLSKIAKPDETKMKFELLDALMEKKGSVTPRDVYRGNKSIAKNEKEASDILAKHASAGRSSIVAGSRGKYQLVS